MNGSQQVYRCCQFRVLARHHATQHHSAHSINVEPPGFCLCNRICHLARIQEPVHTIVGSTTQARESGGHPQVLVDQIQLDPAKMQPFPVGKHHMNPGETTLA